MIYLQEYSEHPEFINIHQTGAISGLFTKIATVVSLNLNSNRDEVSRWTKSIKRSL